jgi:hypothetical protein
VGTHAAVPNVPGLSYGSTPHTCRGAGARLFTATSNRDRGGYSGLELAQAFRRFGSYVTSSSSVPAPGS